MGLPTQVIIFGQKFKIKETSLGGVYGICDRASKTIYLEINQDPKEKLHTLIHEIGHAVFGRISLVQGVSPELEEVIVDTIATALVENSRVLINQVSQ